MFLTDTAIKAAKPATKTLKLRDGGSLFLFVELNGTKRFMLLYRWQGKQKTLALGVYPTVSLKDARKKRDEAKELLSQGVDPSAQRKALKDRQTSTASFSFHTVATRWFAFYQEGIKSITAKRSWSLLEKYIFPWIARQDIREIRRIELVARLEPIIEMGFRETAEKTARIVSSIFEDAVNRGLMDYSVAVKLGSVVPSHKAEHRAAILDREEFGRLLNAVDEDITLTASVRYCLRLLPYVFLRHTELRGARWEEFDFSHAVWTIPAERMKMGVAHVVPLATQVIGFLEELKFFSGSGKLLFPSPASRSRPISDSAMRVALRRLGYAKEAVSVHGFRSTASTFLHEMGFPSDIIERQLAHKDTNAIRAAYNHAEFMPERVQMMQQWADYIDSLKDSHKR